MTALMVWQEHPPQGPKISSIRWQLPQSQGHMQGGGSAWNIYPDQGEGSPSTLLALYFESPYNCLMVVNLVQTVISPVMHT